MSDGGDMGSSHGPRHGRCPICKEPGTERYRPFCSKRCANIDLARWLGEGYVIEGGNSDADADEDGDGDLPPTANREQPDADA